MTTQAEKKPLTPEELGRRGGLIGGRAYAEKMTPEEHSAWAARASRIRWEKFWRERGIKPDRHRCPGCNKLKVIFARGLCRGCAYPKA